MIKFKIGDRIFDEKYEPIEPVFNRLVIFKVEKVGMHYVSEVKKKDYKRKALTGWFNTTSFNNSKKEKTLI